MEGKSLTFRQTRQKKKKTKDCDAGVHSRSVKIFYFFIFARHHQSLPGPESSSSDGRLLHPSIHPQNQRYIPRLYIALIKLNYTEAGSEEAGPCTKGTYKRCHCCVLEVREQLTILCLGTICCAFPRPAGVSSLNSSYLYSFLGIHLLG